MTMDEMEEMLARLERDHGVIEGELVGMFHHLVAPLGQLDDVDIAAALRRWAVPYTSSAPSTRAAHGVPPSDLPRDGAPVPFPTLDQPAGVQARLIADGFPVPLSGNLDEETLDGLRLFQFEWGLEPTGELDTETLEYLGAVEP